jgi:RNA polymerase sigma-70 factor (ECF subfamily)
MDQRSDAEVYRAHATELTRFATVLVGPDSAQDVVAEAVIRMIGSRVWMRAGDRRALLFRAVLFEARNLHRSAVRRRLREEKAAMSATIFPDDEPALEVGQAVRGLSPQQRAVVFLAYWQDLDVTSIARLLGVSDGTVRRQLARARGRLREVLG